MKEEKKKSQKRSTTSKKKSFQGPKIIYSGDTPSGIPVIIAEDTVSNHVFLLLDFTVITLPTKDFKDVAISMFSVSSLLAGK